MTFITPTIAAAADPGPLVYAELEPAMLSAGWTLVDTVVLSTRTHKVFKSAAAGNARNLDWYVDISYPTTGVATHLLITPFEMFDPATDLAYRGPFTSSNATIETTYYSRYGATGNALETNWSNVGATYTTLDTNLGTAGFSFWASITLNRVIFMCSLEPTLITYTGFWVPTAAHIAHAGTALYPLVTVKLSGTSDRAPQTTQSAVQAGVTRVPKYTALSWSNCCVVGPNPRSMNGKVGGASAALGDGRFTAAPYQVGIGDSSWSGGTVTYVGDLDGMYCAWGDAAVVRGDTVTIDGNTYVTSSVTSNAIMIFRQV